MSRLSKLYDAMQTLRNEGLALEDIENQVSQLEEEIIQKEILPIVTESIAPALKEVQRELVLVVDYKPNEPISVHLSRRRNIMDAIDDAKVITPDPSVEHKVNNTPRKKKQDIAPRTAIKVTMPDGTVLQENNAAMTLVETIRQIGVERVRQVCEQSEGKLLRPNKVLLVSNTIDKKYETSQKPIHSNGIEWYVMTCSDTPRKKQQIEEIAKVLGMHINVEII